MSDSGSLIVSLLGIVETARITFPTVADMALGRLTREACDQRLDDWSRRMIERARVDLVFRRREMVPEGETFIVMSNHQSHYDVPVLYRAFSGISLRMVAKSELYKIPFFGEAMRAAEMLEVDRRDPTRARESLSHARERIESGINVWIAPEGTRSITGKLGAFKKGGFILALETGTRILPITLDGTRDVLPSHAKRVRRGKCVTVTFHSPIDPHPYGIEHRDALVADVRASIASALPESMR